MQLKYSKQRQAIKSYLMTRKDHPTADFIYMQMREEIPNISLGTVYRNLNLLADMGEIQRIRVEGTTDRFDGNPAPHYHFVCRDCGCVQDVPIQNDEHLNQVAEEVFDGQIEGHVTYFYGLCAKCMIKSSK